MTDNRTPDPASASQYVFCDLPKSPDQLDVPHLTPIVDRLEGLWLWAFYACEFPPPETEVTEWEQVMDEIVPHVRAMAVNVGFLLWLAKRVRRFSGVQRALRLTDETAHRLERMYLMFVKHACFEPQQFIGGDIEKLDAVAEEFERRIKADGEQFASEERRALVSAALPPQHFETFYS